MSKDLVPLSIKAVRKLVGTKSVAAVFETESAKAVPYDATTTPVTRPTLSNDVNQQRSSVGRDQIGVQNVYVQADPKSAVGIDALLNALQKEMEDNVHSADTIAKLQRFHRPSPYGGVIGLQAKLNVSGRSFEYDEAIEMKELFAKLLETFSLYASAQEIIALLLARVEYHFRQFVYPQLADLSIVQVNEIVDTRIVKPTIDECGSSVFGIDHSLAMGMIYWLADQCHVRWHQ